MQKVEHLIFNNGTPRKNKIILGLLLLRFPLFIPLVKFLIKRSLRHCKDIDFLPRFVYYLGNIYAEKVHFGDGLFMDYAPIYIGKGSSFGWQCMVATGYHDPKDYKVVHAKSVIIGENVQINSRTIILGGVRIGNRAVIGAGSVVTKDVPANCFAAGNPAKVIKHLAKS